jgi:RND family efflux transporter MFP subunit
MNTNSPCGPSSALARVAAATVLFTLVVVTGCARKPAASVEPPPARVEVRDITTESGVIDYEDFTGRTEPYRLIEIRPQLTGELRAIHFQDGDYVNKGDLLFELDDTLFAAQRDSSKATLEVAQANVNLNEALYRSAKTAYDKGGLSPDEFKKTDAELEKARATERLARAELNKTQKTLAFTRIHAPESGRLSRRRVDPGAIVKENDTMLTTLVALERIYVSFDVDERTLLKLRRMLGERKITSSREVALEVRVGLADTEGFDFVAVVKFFDNVLDQNTGTLRMRGEMLNPYLHRERDPAMLDGPIPAAVGVPATMQPTEVWPAPNAFIAAVGAPFALRAQDRSFRLLSPGMFVRVRFPIGREHPGLVIPEEALSSEQGRKFAYVIRNKEPGEKGDMKGVPEQVWVNTGPQVLRKIDGRDVAYRVVTAADDKQPLSPGDPVIVTGIQKVRKGKDGTMLPVVWSAGKKG